MPLITSKSNPPLEGRRITVQGRTVHHHVTGDGPPVLLLHGNGSLGEEILSPFRCCAGRTWIAPDRPGYGFSEALDRDHQDPEALACWTLAFLDALALERVTLAAHSLAAGAALCLAAQAPERIQHLVLLAPFCRPTPHRWMIGLRIAVAPVIGRPVRRLLLPNLLPLFRAHILENMLDPAPVPPWLKRFPLEHAARGPALRTMAAELRRFNEGMERLAPRLHVNIPVTALFGATDETAPAHWHEPWLRRHVGKLVAIHLPKVGHAVHHAAPAAALTAITGGSTPAR